MQDIIEEIKTISADNGFYKSFGDIGDPFLELDELAKSLDATNVPFPSKALRENLPGMQSTSIDEWQVVQQGDYWEKPGISMEQLKAIVDRTEVVGAIIQTRVRQLLRFCQPAESGTDKPGFTITHIDQGHKLTDEDKKNITFLTQFIMNCGSESDPRKRKRLKRDSFPQFMAKVGRDSLRYDSVGIETEWKGDKGKGIDGFYAVDGSTIRLCPENGFRGDEEKFAVQIIGGTVRAAYGYDDLIYEPRNPRADVNVSGYGMPEVEYVVKSITGFLNGMTSNMKVFDSSMPRGFFNMIGNVSAEDLAAFRQYWNALVRGVENRGAVPVLTSKDAESKITFERIDAEPDEMMFSKWMTFLTSIICAYFGMSPAEIHIDSFTAGNTSALAGSDLAEKIASSKDSGLRPLLMYFQNLITDFIISTFNPNYCFRWTGLDPDDIDKTFELRKTVLTVDELRSDLKYDPIGNGLGDCPVNQSLVTPWLQLNMPQGEDQSQDEDASPQDKLDTQKDKPEKMVKALADELLTHIYRIGD